MADRQFVVEAIFRAQDRLSSVLQAIQGNAQSAGKSLSSGPIATSGQAFDALAVKVTRVGQAFQTGNFKSASKDIDAVSRSTQQLAQSLSSGDFSGAARAAANLGSAFTATALPAATLAKEFEKVKGLGIASADGLLAIQGAASAADVSLKVVASGLTNFRARILSAQEGTGRAASALRNLGATSEQIRSGFGGTAQALTFVSSRLAQVSDEAERALIASRLFGQAGQQLVPIMGSLASAETAVAGSSAAMGASLLPIVAIVGTVVAAIAGLVVAVKTTQAVIGAGIEGAAFADQMGDIAEKTGLTTEEVSRLNFGASQTDVTIQQLAGGMRFLAQNLQKAREDGSEAQINFIALGFTLKDLESGAIAPREALLKMADAIASVQDPLVRTALASKFLGEGIGAQLVPFLSKGSAGIREFENAADKMRATVTQAQAAVGEKFEQSVNALNLQMAELKAQIGEGVVPSLTGLVTTASEVVVGINVLRDRVNDLATAFRVLNGVDPSVFFVGIRETVIALTPGLSQALALLQAIQSLGQKKVTGPQSPASAEHGAGENFKVTTPDQVIDFAKRVAALEAEKKAHEEAAAAAKKHAEEMLKLRAAFEAVIAGTNNLDVPRDAAKIFFELDPKAAPKVVEDLQKVIDEVKKEAEKATIKIPAELDIHRKVEAPTAITDLAPLETIQTDLVIAGARGQDLIAIFEQMGIPIDALKEKLAVIGPDLSAIGEVALGVGSAMEEAFSEAFDPVKVGVEGAMGAVFNLRTAFDGAFSSLSNALVTGQTGFIKLGNVIEGAVLALRKFVIELGIAIAKAAILRVITGGLFAGGGGVSKAVTNDHPWGFASGGAIPRFASGGSVATALGSTSMRIQRFASGGGVGAHFTSPIFAASGLAIAGAPNRMDNVPIWASQGEFVLPNLGSTSGVDIARSLAGGLDAIKGVLREVGRSERESSGAGPIFGAIHIHANDSDSIRNSVRPGGSFEKQLARAAELGR